MSPSSTTPSPQPTPAKVDDDDFASIWESTIVPLLLNLLMKNCGPQSDFSVDVHSFPVPPSREEPGQDTQSVSSRRVIYISMPAPEDMVAGSGDYSSLENTIRRELERVVPARLGSLHLRFRTIGRA